MTVPCGFATVAERLGRCWVGARNAAPTLRTAIGVRRLIGALAVIAPLSPQVVAAPPATRVTVTG